MATAVAQPWVEKYRPKNVSEVAYQEEVVNTLTRALETANLPHLLFYGPPGTGKTSTALAIARQLYGPELFKTRVLELNASDERGINVVREKVKAFAAGAVGQPVAGYPCPPYKLLILDEADSMTQDAQNALRRTMETHSKVTRFCFICNYVSRIIEPLASRCAKFRFKPLHADIMSNRISYICGKEGVQLEGDAMDMLGQVSGGDLRRAITTLQSAVRLGGNAVSRQAVLDVSSQIPPEVISSLLTCCKAATFQGLQKQITDIIAEGYAAQQVLLQLQGSLLADTQALAHRQASWMRPRAFSSCSVVALRAPVRVMASVTATKKVEPEQSVPGMTKFLDSLKYDSNGLLAVIVQHIDTGEVMMQAYADRAAVSETLQTGLATFYSRSRKGRWCKGETSGHFINVHKLFADCDKDSLIYLSDPIGPACHTGARTCWFSEASLEGAEHTVHTAGDHKHNDHVPMTTLLALEKTIADRRKAMQTPTEGKPSWTARLLSNPELLCKKVREEAGELCQTLEASEGKERAANEMADLLYHAMVLLNLQEVPVEDVMRVLRKRFGTSGVEEKAARPPKPSA